MTSLYKLLSLLLVTCFLPSGWTESFNDVMTLKQDLLSNYSTGILPLRNQSQHVLVSVSFYLIKIQSLNMRNQVLTLSGWLKFEWLDEFLQWEPQLYGGINELILFQNQVWLPDVLLENTAENHKELGSEHMLVSVLSNGQVHWEPGLISETSCAVDITKYPFDSQQCEVRFLTWMHTNRTLIVVPEADVVDLNALLPNGEWDIISTKAEAYKYPSSYRLGTEHTGVNFIFKLYRKRFFYILNTMIPVMLLSTLNVLVFILPSDCGERMALAVTVLLAFTVYLSIISENIPKTSEDTSILTIYLTMLLALSTASVVCAGIVLNIHFRDPHMKIPGYVVSIFSKFCLDSRDTLSAKRHSHNAFPDPRRLSSLSRGTLQHRYQYDTSKKVHSDGLEVEMTHEQTVPLVPSLTSSPSGKQQRHQSRVAVFSSDLDMKDKDKSSNSSTPKMRRQAEQLTSDKNSSESVHTPNEQAVSNSATREPFGESEHSRCRREKSGESTKFTRKPSMFSTFAVEIQKLLDQQKRRRFEEEITWHDIGNTLDRFLFWVFFFLTGSVNIIIVFLLSY